MKGRHAATLFLLNINHFKVSNQMEAFIIENVIYMYARNWQGRGFNTLPLKVYYLAVCLFWCAARARVLMNIDSSSSAPALLLGWNADWNKNILNIRVENLESIYRICFFLLFYCFHLLLVRLHFGITCLNNNKIRGKWGRCCHWMSIKKI